MRDEIERILAMRERGELTREAAASRLEALARQRSSRETSDDPRRSFGGIGRDIQNVLEQASKTVGAVLRTEEWVNERNSATLSRAEPPVGENFRCHGNRLHLVRVAGLRLSESEFTDNDLQAGALEKLECNQAIFARNALRASYLDRVRIDDGEFSDNQCNAVRLTDWRLVSSRVTTSRFNAVQASGVALSGATVRDARWNGVQLTALVLRNGAAMEGLALNGVAGRNWLLDDTTLSDVTLTGLQIGGFTCLGSRLAGCVLRHADWVRGLDRRDLFRVRDLRIERSNLENCEFVDCRFADTTFVNVHASDLVFRNVDFSGKTVASSEELERLAAGPHDD